MHFSREIPSHVQAISTSVLSRLDSFCVVSPAFSLPFQAGTDYPNAEMDFCVGYVTASGVLLLKKMFNTAHKARAVVGLCVQNKVSAFQRLQDFGVEVYLYTTGSNTIFHPKIYFGATKAQVWAMIGVPCQVTRPLRHKSLPAAFASATRDFGAGPT